jgi:hypothetical protein
LSSKHSPFREGISSVKLIVSFEKFVYSIVWVKNDRSLKENFENNRVPLPAQRCPGRAALAFSIETRGREGWLIFSGAAGLWWI